MIHCPECDTTSVVKNGFRGEHRRYKCKDCGNSFLDIHVKNDGEADINISGSLEAELTPEGQKIRDEVISPRVIDPSEMKIVHGPTATLESN